MVLFPVILGDQSHLTTQTTYFPHFVSPFIIYIFVFSEYSEFKFGR